MQLYSTSPQNSSPHYVTFTIMGRYLGGWVGGGGGRYKGADV